MKKIIIGATLAVATVGAFAFAPMAVNAAALHANGNGSGSHTASGNGNGYQSSLETRAKAVNMTTTQLQEALKTKTMDQIMADQKVSTDAYHAAVRDAATTRWQSRGLSDAEIKERQTWQADRQADCDGTGDHENTGGFGRQNR